MSEETKKKAPSSVPVPTSKKGPAAFFRDVKREAKMISWPTFQETTRLSSTVIGVCVLVAVVLFVMSIAIEQFLKFLLGVGAG